MLSALEIQLPLVSRDFPLRFENQAAIAGGLALLAGDLSDTQDALAAVEADLDSTRDKVIDAEVRAESCATAAEAGESMAYAAFAMSEEDYILALDHLEEATSTMERAGYVDLPDLFASCSPESA